MATIFPEARSRTPLIMIVLSIAVGCALTWHIIDYRQASRLQAQTRISNHARVIASSLWTFDRSGPLAYLILATEANGYNRITIRDESNSVFLSIPGPADSALDRFLQKVRLINTYELSSDIVYEGITIGRISAQWPDKSIYRSFYLVFSTLLTMIGVALLLKLIEAKQSLERRVRERTEALESEVGERRKTEEALRSYTQRLALHVMNTPLGVIEWNNDFEIVDWNKAAEQIFGYTKAEAIGLKGPDLIALDTEKKQVEEIWRQLLNQAGGSRSVNSNLTKSGGTIICEWHNTTLTDQDGRVIGAASLVLDITERKKAEEKNRLLQSQLLQAQKMEAIGNLAGGIAHDFNNILQTISGNTHLLLTDPKENNEQNRRLHAIETASRRAAELVRQMLTFSRKIESDLRPLDLNHEISQVRNMLERTIPKMIAIDLLLDEHLYSIRADSVQIEQVMLNLSINAMHAMPHGGTLTIQTENVQPDQAFCNRHVGATDGWYVRLSVRDTGTGMDKSIIDHVFEPFFTTKAVGQGTGLGLSIVYGIVKNHRGHIECHSEPGTGTTFDIFFPALLESRSTNSSASRLDIIPQGDETVLIIDDDETIRDICKAFLTMNGYRVICAATGEKGIKMLGDYRESTISLVILDLNMPGMGGFKCLQHIHEKHPESAVLIASGYAPAEVVSYAVNHGASGVMTKPFQMKELLSSVRQAIDLHKVA